MKAILKDACVRSIAVVILLNAISDVRAQSRESIKLNKIASAFAAELIKEGHVITDGKGAWSKHRPSADEENEFIRVHGFGNMQNGISGSMIATRRIRRADTNFRTAISRMFIAAGCLRQKPELANMVTPKSKTRRRNWNVG